jgi:hypothetical protein
MEKEFIPYEQALALKELGFDELCFKLYIDKKLQIFSNENQDYIKNSDFENKYISAPLYQQAFRWFREKYNLTFTIKRRFNCYNIIEILEYNSIDDGNVDVELDGLDWEDFKTYEEAELEYIKKLIETVKNK